MRKTKSKPELLDIQEVKNYITDFAWGLLVRYPEDYKGFEDEYIFGFDLEESDELGCSMKVICNLENYIHGEHGISKKIILKRCIDYLQDLVLKHGTLPGRIGINTFAVTTTSNLKFWEEVLKKSKIFTPVKTFINMNTQNTVTLWVSNN